MVGNQVTGMDLHLQPAGQITGMVTVTQAFTAPSISVHLLQQGGLPDITAWKIIQTLTLSASGGAYTFTDLGADRYLVCANGFNFMFPTYECYNNRATIERAARITLTVGLTGGPLFDGGVTGRVTAGGSPLAGAIVALYKGDNFCCPLRLDDPQVSVLTNQDGYYTINGLASGSYKLGVSDPTGIYATTYYTTHVAPAVANTLSIKESNVLTNVNLVLPLAGAVSGRVTTVKGHPVAGLSVLVYANISSERTVKFWSLVSSDARTDENGQYTIRGLHAGAYHVCFLSTRNILHCHGALYTPDPSSLVANALPVTLAAGETKSNINLLWGPVPLYYLPLIVR